MNHYLSKGFDVGELPGILERIPVAITVIDLQGSILYFNDYAARILDRKPEYLGQDIRQCHKKSASIQKIDQILADFIAGIRVQASYEANRFGNDVVVVFTPLIKDGKVCGVIQSVTIKNAAPSV